MIRFSGKEIIFLVIFDSLLEKKSTCDFFFKSSVNATENPKARVFVSEKAAKFVRRMKVKSKFNFFKKRVTQITAITCPFCKKLQIFSVWKSMLTKILLC